MEWVANGTFWGFFVWWTHFNSIEFYLRTVLGIILELELRLFDNWVNRYRTNISAFMELFKGLVLKNYDKILIRKDCQTNFFKHFPNHSSLPQKFQLNCNNNQIFYFIFLIFREYSEHFQSSIKYLHKNRKNKIFFPLNFIKTWIIQEKLFLLKIHHCEVQ